MSLTAYYYGPSTLGSSLFFEPSSRSPAFSCDVSETQDAFVVQADLPGVKKENIDVKIERQVLTIRATRDSRPDGEAEKVYLRERSSGAMTRSFKLPSGVLVETAKSSFEDGSLIITFSKDPEYTTTRKIEIQ